MVFNSYDFWLVFPPVYLLYLALGRRAQNVLLLLFSYFFYGCWDWRFLALLGATTVWDFWLGRRIHAASGLPAKRAYLGLSMLGNVGTLCAFKYYGFFADNLQRLLAVLHVTVSLPVLHVILPLGISFYTFESLSYVIDVYKGKIRPATSLLSY